MTAIKLHKAVLNAGFCTTLLLTASVQALAAADSTPRVDTYATIKIVPKPESLRDEVFQRVRPGMSADEVVEMIGTPHGKMRFAATGTTAWDYRYQDSWGNRAEFSVILNDAGIVVGKFSNGTLAS